MGAALCVINNSLELAVLRDAAQSAGLKAHDAHHLHQHATSIYLLPAERVVARLKRGPGTADAAARAIAITRWLHEQDFPATQPADVEQPQQRDGYVVTFWQYYPQEQRTTPAPLHLGAILRQFHQLPAPPVELPTV